MIKQGVDDYGAEYKRTTHDFSFKFLTQDNCVCNIATAQVLSGVFDT